MTTFYSLLRHKNASYKPEPGKSSELEDGIQYMRTQTEEAYKQIIAPTLGYFLNQLVVVNDSLPHIRRSGHTLFAGKTVPEISIENYLERIIKYTPCSPECYLIAIIYLDKLVQTQGLIINGMNVHRILITGIMIAAKLYDDFTYNNKYYSHVGGIACAELNAMEAKFLSLLNYNLVICPEIFECYRHEVEASIIVISIEEEREKRKRVTDDESICICDECENTESLEKARYNAHLLSKQLRRSRSFNNSSSENGLLNWRKRRSSSFNLLVLA